MARDYFTKTKQFHIGDVAIDSDAIKYALWKLPNAIKITAVRVASTVACAAADTNYNTFALTDITDTIGSDANGPVSGGTTWAAGVFQDMTLVAAQVVRAADDTLQFEVTKTGSGLALDGVLIQIDYVDYNN